MIFFITQEVTMITKNYFSIFIFVFNSKCCTSSFIIDIILYFPVIMYGYVLISGHIFPLASLLVFINTIVSLRIHAAMFCQCLRRPVPRPVVDLEVWDTIIPIVSIIGTIVMVTCPYFVIE